ncbi:MAG: TonB-dependent receptor [Opitutaceae bacterium]|nr:TonB-dependent receptor [Cytophagales bacterium]
MKKLIPLLILYFFQVSTGLCQITSSNISGNVKSTSGEGLIGVAIQATHKPTGTNYIVESDISGNYYIANMQPGGPYVIKMAYTGYKPQQKDSIYLQLGETLSLDLKMVDESVQTEEVVVTGNQEIKTGTGTTISNVQIRELPTISRSITDFTRLTPQSSNNSFAGTNFRYNNITVDGAINNDAIGFSPSLGGVGSTSGMPGSSTRTQPLSLDAIETVSAQIAPYDTKIGNFTGGSINAVTRRGTNDVTGSVYAFGRNASITGPNNVSGDKSKMPSSYYDYQTGFRVGFPLVKDKLFFFTNEEITRRQEPQFFGAGTSNSVLSGAQAQRITDSLMSPTFMPTTQYDPKGTYNPGTYGDYNIYSNSTKFFNRLDWNITNKHQFLIRNNYVTSEATNLDRTQTQFQFGGYDWLQKNTQVSTVAELKSRFSNRFSNDAIIGYTNIHDYRDPGAIAPIFPQIEINNVNGGGQVFLGTNREAGIFNTRQKTLEITNNLSYYRGKHAFTLGTHNELYTIDYGFINSWNGRISYNTLSDFYSNNMSRFRTFYNLGTDNTRDYNFNNPSASFKINMYSLYLQDEWTVNSRLKVMPGIRADMTSIPHNPIYNEQLRNFDPGTNLNSSYELNNQVNQVDSKLFGQTMISPRLGFNWDVAGNKKLIVRGGSGVFTGRIPFAWLGYAYYNNGVSYGAIDSKVVPKGTNIPTDPTQFQAAAGSGYLGPQAKVSQKVEEDLIDNNFKMPRTWRSSLAFDIMLPGNYKLTLEGIYTKVINDVKLQNANLNDGQGKVTYYGYDVNHEQPIYSGNLSNNNYSNIYILSNTNQGYRYNLTTQIQKTYSNGINFMAAYTYSESKDILNGIRNSPESGWQLNQALSPNSPKLSYSNFNIPHRFVVSAGYKKDWNKALTSYVSMIFTAESGQPFTWGNIENKYTNNGQQVNLAFIPQDRSQIHLIDYALGTDGTITASDNAGYNKALAGGATVVTADQQWQGLDNFVSSDKYLSARRGNFTERNAAHTPWNNRLDLRLMQDFNFYAGKNARKQTFQVSFDIINLTNLLNPKWGWSYYASNTFNNTVFTGIASTGNVDKASNNPNVYFVQPKSTYNVDYLQSRFQCQLGVRYLF